MIPETFSVFLDLRINATWKFNSADCALCLHYGAIKGSDVQKCLFEKES